MISRWTKDFHVVVAQVDRLKANIETSSSLYRFKSFCHQSTDEFNSCKPAPPRAERRRDARHAHLIHHRLGSSLPGVRLVTWTIDCHKWCFHRCKITRVKSANPTIAAIDFLRCSITIPLYLASSASNAITSLSAFFISR